MIDIHSHILPCVDDGPKSLAGSIAIVRRLISQGVTDIIATPHFVNETNFVSPKAQNQRVLAVVKRALEKEGININIFLGNEIYIDNNILELLKAKKISGLAGKRILLVELPLDGEYANYKDILMDLRDAGYAVILAHPERYAIIQKDIEIAKELRRMGVLFQCNIGSILGKYGKGAKKTVKKLIKERMIFTFGSDIHHDSRTDYITLAKKKLLKYYTEKELHHLLVVNPGKIVGC